MADVGQGQSVDLVSVSVEPTNVPDPNFAGAFWRKDRRPILRDFLAEYTQRTFPGNPRGYAPALVGNAFDVPTFRKIMLDNADTAGRACVARNAQGYVAWDVTGQEFGHSTTYFGNPDEIAFAAPEFDVIADEYFARLKSYSLRIGCTLRCEHVPHGASFPALPDPTIAIGDPFLRTDLKPPHRIWTRYVDAKYPDAWYDWSLGGGSGNNRGPGQRPIRTSDDVTAAKQRVIARIKYCKDRWGMSLFYVDSTVWEYGEPLPASMWAEIQKAHPDVLIMPENEDGYTYHPYSVPYGQFDGGSIGPEYYSTNPDAMMMVAFNEQATDEMFAQWREILRAQYKANRILLMTYWQDSKNLARIAEIMS